MSSDEKFDAILKTMKEQFDAANARFEKMGEDLKNEMKQGFEEVKQRFNEVNERFAAVDERFIKTESFIDSTKEQISSLVEQNLNGK